MNSGGSHWRLSQLEGHVNQRCVIYRMPILDRGLEPDLLGNTLCLLIQTMPQPVHYTQYLYLATGQKTHLQGYLTLNLQLSCFRGVFGMRLRYYNRRNESRFGRLDSHLGGRTADVVGKAGRGHRTGAT